VSPGHLVTLEGWHKLSEKLAAALAGYHRRYPLRSWMPREELRSRLKLGTAAYDALMSAAVARGLTESGEAGARLPGHTPRLTPEQERQTRAWLDAMAGSPYSPPPPDLDPEVIALLLEQGAVARVAPDLLFLSQAYREMEEWVRGQVAGGGSLTLAQFRDRFGSSRKYAQAMLEHLDERKITRRVGDARVVY
jgi:selenocysteine-specific elongation factor